LIQNAADGSYNEEYYHGGFVIIVVNIPDTAAWTLEFVSAQFDLTVATDIHFLLV
jgi:hypothetical protein